MLKNHITKQLEKIAIFNIPLKNPYPKSPDNYPSLFGCMVHQNKVTFYSSIALTASNININAQLQIQFANMQSLVNPWFPILSNYNLILLHSFWQGKLNKQWPTFLTICVKYENISTKTLECLNLEPHLRISDEQLERRQSRSHENQELHKFSKINRNTWLNANPKFTADLYAVTEG